MKLTKTITRNLYSADLGLVLTRAVFSTYDVDYRHSRTPHLTWRDDIQLESIKLVDLPHVAESQIPESFCQAMLEKALDTDISDWDEAEA